MKAYLSILILIIGLSQAKGQAKVTAKEVVNYVGKQVTLCDSVYSARALDNISLMNLGGAFPKELLTVVVFKADRNKFEKDPVDLFEHKRICVTGKVVLYKEKLQIVVNDPKQIKLN